MIGSYVMVDPAGRFYDNVDSAYRYSRPILEVGAAEALNDVSVFRDVFLDRKGDYHANPTMVLPLRVMDAAMARLATRKPTPQN
jgi:hypothetical protein